MGRIKITEPSDIEGDLVRLGATDKQARVIGAVVRGVASDILNERNDQIRFKVNGVEYLLTLTKE